MYPTFCKNKFHGGFLGKWVKYNFYVTFYYLRKEGYVLIGVRLFASRITQKLLNRFHKIRLK